MQDESCVFYLTSQGISVSGTLWMVPQSSGCVLAVVLDLMLQRLISYIGEEFCGIKSRTLESILLEVLGQGKLTFAEGCVARRRPAKGKHPEWLFIRILSLMCCHHCVPLYWWVHGLLI